MEPRARQMLINPVFQSSSSTFKPPPLKADSTISPIPIDTMTSKLPPSPMISSAIPKDPYKVIQVNAVGFGTYEVLGTEKPPNRNLKYSDTKHEQAHLNRV